MPSSSTTGPITPSWKPAPRVVMVLSPLTRTRQPACSCWPCKSMSNSSAPDSSCNTNRPAAESAIKQSHLNLSRKAYLDFANSTAKPEQHSLQMRGPNHLQIDLEPPHPDIGTTQRPISNM